MARPDSLEQTKPWEAKGISRRTWFRRRACGGRDNRRLEGLPQRPEFTEIDFTGERPARLLVPMCYRVLREIIGDECAPATARIAAIRLVLTLAAAQEAAKRANSSENIGKKATAAKAAMEPCEGDVDWGNDLESCFDRGNALRSRVRRD
jgi:hypothetical protein